MNKADIIKKDIMGKEKISFGFEQKKKRSDRRECLANRRQAQRFKACLPLQFRLRGASRWRKTSTTNISGKGLGFSTTKALPSGKIIEIKIYTRERKPQVFLGMGKVCRVKKINKQKFNIAVNVKPMLRFEIGLEFGKINNFDEFTDFICEKMVDIFLTPERRQMIRRKKDVATTHPKGSPARKA